MCVRVCFRLPVIYLSSRPSFTKLSIWPVQACWWLCLAFAGPPSTWTAWRGATLTSRPSSTSRSSSTSTLSLESASTWALPSTPSSTTSCPPSSEKCSVTLPVILTAGRHAPAYRWPNAALWARNCPTIRNGRGQMKSENIKHRRVTN